MTAENSYLHFPTGHSQLDFTVERQEAGWIHFEKNLRRYHGITYNTQDDSDVIILSGHGNVHYDQDLCNARFNVATGSTLTVIGGGDHNIITAEPDSTVIFNVKRLSFQNSFFMGERSKLTVNCALDISHTMPDVGCITKSAITLQSQSHLHMVRN